MAWQRMYVYGLMQFIMGILIPKMLKIRNCKYPTQKDFNINPDE